MKNLYWVIVRYINMKLFEIIPADFFSVLVSPNREIYADALMKLYEMFRTEINIRLKSFLAEVEILLEDREYYNGPCNLDHGIEKMREHGIMRLSKGRSANHVIQNVHVGIQGEGSH